MICLQFCKITYYRQVGKEAVFTKIIFTRFTLEPANCVYGNIALFSPTTQTMTKHKYNFPDASYGHSCVWPITKIEVRC